MSVLDPRGVPTPGAPVQILPPSSSMGAIDDAQFQRVMAGSSIASKYANAVDRQSAYEMLRQRMSSSAATAPEPSERDTEAPAPAKRGGAREEKSMLDEVLGSRAMKNAANQAVRSLVREGMRGLFGMLKK